MCYLARRREKSIRQLLDIHAFFNLYLCMLNNLPFYMFMSMSRKCLSLNLSEFFQLKQFNLLKSSDKYFYNKNWVNNFWWRSLDFIHLNFIANGRRRRRKKVKVRGMQGKWKIVVSERVCQTNIFFSIQIKLFICRTFCRYKLLHPTTLLPFGFTFLFINALL